MSKFHYLIWIACTGCLGDGVHRPAGALLFERTARADTGRSAALTLRSSLTLEGALSVAKQNNRLVAAARFRIREARGDLTTASMLLLNNPQVAASAGPRLSTQAGQETKLDLDIGIQQRFEIGGQRRNRINRARANIEAAWASAENVQRVVDLAVAVTFYEALGNKQRLDLLAQNEQLARDLLGTARRRLEVGESTRLELNTARIRFADARRRTIGAQTALRSSIVRLAEILGLAPGTLLKLSGDLPTRRSAPTMDALLARARSSRPDLLAAERRVKGARAGVALADAKARPDITVGLFYRQEEGDHTIAAGLRVPIPLFNRNQGERLRARATLERQIAEREAVSLSVVSEVRRAFLTYDQARRTLRLYDAEVLRAQRESADLLRRAFQAGEVGLPEVITVQRVLLTGRAGLVDARLQLARALATLLASAGLPQTGFAPAGRR